MNSCKNCQNVLTTTREIYLGICCECDINDTEPEPQIKVSEWD